MFIDTNKAESDYQDDHFVEVKSEYSRLKQELQEIRQTRAYRRTCRTWNWTLEAEFRNEQEHLQTMIQNESGVY